MVRNEVAAQPSPHPEAAPAARLPPASLHLGTLGLAQSGQQRSAVVTVTAAAAGHVPPLGASPMPADVTLRLSQISQLLTAGAEALAPEPARQAAWPRRSRGTIRRGHGGWGGPRELPEKLQETPPGGQELSQGLCFGPSRMPSKRKLTAAGALRKGREVET